MRGSSVDQVNLCTARLVCNGAQRAEQSTPTLRRHAHRKLGLPKRCGVLEEARHRNPGSRSPRMRPMVDVGFFAPRWAAAQPRRFGGAPAAVHRRKFARFAKALAGRYSGLQLRPARSPLARMVRGQPGTSRTSPNFLLHSGSAAMAAGCRRRRTSIAKPMLRGSDIIRGGVSARNKGAHRRPSTSDSGAARPRGRGSPPLQLQSPELACVDRRLRPLKRRECRHFTPLPRRSTRVLQRIPTRARSGPRRPPTSKADYVTYNWRGPPGPGDALATTNAGGWPSRSKSGTSRNTGMRPRPPDPRGVSLKAQARYISAGELYSLAESRVASFAQFLLTDIGPDLPVPHPGHPAPMEHLADRAGVRRRAAQARGRGAQAAVLGQRR